MIGQIFWRTEKRRVRDITPWADNPRKSTPEDEAQLHTSIDRFGYVDPVVLNADGSLIGGHARLKNLTERGLLDEEIDVRVPERQLTPDEAQELALRLNRNHMSWDYDKLDALFPSKDRLLDMGFQKWEFGLQNEPLPIPVYEIDSTEDSREKVEFMASTAPTEEKDMLLFEVLLPKVDRATLFSTLKKIREERDCTNAQALMYIVSYYQENHHGE